MNKFLTVWVIVINLDRKFICAVLNMKLNLFINCKFIQFYFDITFHTDLYLYATIINYGFDIIKPMIDEFCWINHLLVY